MLSLFCHYFIIMLSLVGHDFVISWSLFRRQGHLGHPKIVNHRQTSTNIDNINKMHAPTKTGACFSEVAEAPLAAATQPHSAGYPKTGKHLHVHKRVKFPKSQKHQHVPDLEKLNNRGFSDEGTFH